MRWVICRPKNNHSHIFFRWHLLHNIQISRTRIRRLSRHSLRLRQRCFRLHKHHRFLQLAERTAQPLRHHPYRRRRERHEGGRHSRHLGHDHDLCHRNGMGIEGPEFPHRHHLGCHGWLHGRHCDRAYYWWKKGARLRWVQWWVNFIFEESYGIKTYIKN